MSQMPNIIINIIISTIDLFEEINNRLLRHSLANNLRGKSLCGSKISQRKHIHRAKLMCVCIWVYIAMNSSYMTTPTTPSAQNQKNQPAESDIVSKMFLCVSNYRHTQALRSTFVYLFAVFFASKPQPLQLSTIY